jgi:hypothetical protein
MRLAALIEHLNYWTARYSKRHETAVPTGRRAGRLGTLAGISRVGYQLIATLVIRS